MKLFNLCLSSLLALALYAPYAHSDGDHEGPKGGLNFSIAEYSEYPESFSGKPRFQRLSVLQDGTVYFSIWEQSDKGSLTLSDDKKTKYAILRDVKLPKLSKDETARLNKDIKEISEDDPQDTEIKSGRSRTALRIVAEVFPKALKASVEILIVKTDEDQTMTIRRKVGDHISKRLRELFNKGKEADEKEQRSNRVIYIK